MAASRTEARCLPYQVNTISLRLNGTEGIIETRKPGHDWVVLDLNYTKIKESERGEDMKLRVILVCAISTISLLFSGCSADDGISLRASCDDFYEQGEIIKEVQVPTGDSFKVGLCCNPSTAFKWPETASISDEAVIKQINHEFVIAPPGGTPDQEIWNFKAIKKGASIVTIENGHTLEGNGNRGWTFVLTVIAD